MEKKTYLGLETSSQAPPVPVPSLSLSLSPSSFAFAFVDVVAVVNSLVHKKEGKKSTYPGPNDESKFRSLVPLGVPVPSPCCHPVVVAAVRHHDVMVVVEGGGMRRE